MEQIAVVKSILKNGMAEIAIERDTACGAAHSCADCNGCEKMMTKTSNVVVAYNSVEANKGDVVRVRSENANFFKTAAIVYVVPLVLAVLGLVVASFLPFGGEGMQVLLCFVGLALGVPIAMVWDRHMKRTNGLKFFIIEVKKACSGM